MLDESVFLKIRDMSGEFFRFSHHDRSHTERVYRTAVRIADEEGADLEIVKAAALLHDVARSMEDDGEISDHASEGARVAEKILEQVDFPKEKIPEVARCIESHRFRNGMKAESLEAEILQDADRLDVIGAVGIARVFMKGGWDNIPLYDPMVPLKERYDGKSLTAINHISEKLLRIRETLSTKTAKGIAEGRHKFVEEYLDRFLKEWSGEV
jgi:uncharacterized protein